MLRKFSQTVGLNLDRAWVSIPRPFFNDPISSERVGMLPSELKVDIAALVEPFVRAISEFAANQESVASYRFRRAYPSRPDFTSGPNIKAHCVKDRGVVRHWKYP